MGARRAARSPPFRRPVVAFPRLAPVPEPFQVTYDAVQARPHVAAHPSHAVGGPGDPPETVADVLVPIVDVP